jgi:chromate transporter
MNLLLLYLLLLKACVTTFNGMASLPVVRQDLVVERKLLTDKQLAAAVAATQATPGPLGLHVVGVGYFVAGVPGAAMGCLALMTPAFLIIPLLKKLASRAGSPVMRNAVRGLTLASAGLLAAAIVPLARQNLHGPVPALIAVASCLFLVLTGRDTLWVIGGSASAALVARWFGLF